MSLFRPLLLIIFLSGITAPAVAGQPEWFCTWVTSGEGPHGIQHGTAAVTLRKGRITADIITTEATELTLTGRVSGHRIRATFTVKGSDYFMDSPLAGTYVTKKWKGVAGSKGRESIILSDGWNVLCLSRGLDSK